MQLVSSIITPATSSLLVDQATVLDDWGIALNATTTAEYINRLILRASTTAATYCNRVFGVQAIQDEIRWNPWGSLRWNSRGAHVQLSGFPVCQIISVVKDGTALVPNVDYIIDQAKGVLTKIDSKGNFENWYGCDLVVNYQAGYVLPGQDPATLPAGTQLLPADISDAVSRLVNARYSERSRDPYVKSTMAYGIGTIEYVSAKVDGNLPSDVVEILDQYRVPFVA